MFTFWLFGDLRHDDAFITLQYARNLGRGAGLVFNPGERVLGTTSPLHALVLALLAPITGDALPAAGVFLGACALSAQALLVRGFVRERAPGLALGLGLLVAFGLSEAHPWLALETHLFAALVLATLLAVLQHRAILAGLFLGLSFLCRYDGALLIPVACVAWYLRWREPPKVTLLTAFLVVLPWLVGATLYFGSVIPQTFFAKQSISPPLEYLAHYLELFASQPWRALGLNRLHWLAWFSPVFWCVGLVYVVRHARALLPLVAFAVMHLAAYCVMGPSPLQHWHQYPAALVFALLFALGAFGGLESLRRRLAPGASGRVAVAVLGWTLVGAVFVGAARSAEDLVQSHWLGKRHERYAEVAAWLKDHTAADAVVLAPEIGTLGFLTQRRMLDPSGLINPTNEYPREPTMANLAAFALEHRPEVIVLDSPMQGGFFETISSYRIVKVFEWDPWSTILVRSPDVLVVDGNRR